MEINYEEILTEWCYRLPKGFPTIVDGKFGDDEEIIILNEILQERGMQPLQVPHNTTPLIVEGTTEDNSEVLCIYFCCLDQKKIQTVKDYLVSLKKPQTKQTTLPPVKLKLIPGLTATNLGSSGKTALEALLNDYNKGVPNIKLFVNAITSGELIQQEYGTTIPASAIDRGNENFQQIKKVALNLIEKQLSIKLDKDDKWSPADIMIYNGKANLDLVRKAKTLEELNGLFTAGISRESNTIVGISLKQATAQGGKALSFKSSLTREKHFVEADDLGDDDKLTRSWLYLADATNPSKKASDIGYIAELVKKSLPTDKLLNRAAQNIISEAKNTLQLTFGKSQATRILGMSSGQKAKDAARNLFKTKKQIAFSPKYQAAVEAFDTITTKRAKSLYEQTRERFISALREGMYQIDAKVAAPQSSLLLYRKASCYQLATWLITGVAEGGLKIPKGFITLAKEKNPFIALTAYAIGYAGVSPYFVKVIGAGDNVASLNKPAHYVVMGGEGMLKLQRKQKVVIIDNPGYGGFSVNLLLEAGKGVKYDVKLDFRFAGDRINIEVNKVA
jgi:hypothetical protein